MPVAAVIVHCSFALLPLPLPFVLDVSPRSDNEYFPPPGKGDISWPDELPTTTIHPMR